MNKAHHPLPWPARLVRRLALAAALACAGAARADLYVVVHAGNPQRAMAQKEVVDLFMGRSRTFAQGDFALPFDLPRDSAVRERFYQALTGQSLAQVNSYWSRLMFTGQTMPPQALPGESAVADLVRRNPSAIGYLSTEPTDKGLRVVLVLKEPH
ncbi:hypothetical protein V4F39_15885 [Aquincola sp. MAHUQ-54]|uniref:Phosphate ABC transporter substrate-binding protein n=2 Tax=Aquincola TaxID=391952 RepID=A0AAW9QLC1_9BURK